MKAQLVWVVGLMVAAVSLASWTSRAMADDQPALKVAVCDPVKVIRECQEGKDCASQVEAGCRDRAKRAGHQKETA